MVIVVRPDKDELEKVIGGKVLLVGAPSLGKTELLKSICGYKAVIIEHPK